MKRFTVAGSVHLDIFADANVPYSEGLDVEGDFTLAIGGTAFNIATFLSSLKAQVSLISALPRGSLFTRIILSTLKRLGIEHRILLVKDLKEPAFLALRENRDLKLAVTSTCVDSEEIGGKIVEGVEREKGDVLFLETNLSPSVLLSVVERSDVPIYIHAVSKIKSLRLLPISERRDLHGKVKFVFLNEGEWKKLALTTGKRDPRKIIECGWVITMGDKGSIVFLPDGEEVRFPAPHIERVESYSGLGDAFASGFAFGYEETKTIESAVEVAHLLVKKKAGSPHASFVSVKVCEVENELFIDKLTGTFTRSYFEEEKKYLVESESLHTVIMIDIDFFKKINDTYGHDRGDRVLKGVARIIKDNVRDEDLVIRYGGEEFMLILRDKTSITNAKSVAERIRRCVQEAKVDGLSVTISVGLAQDRNLEVAIKKADQALYESKRRGRNRVTCAVK